MMHSKKLTRIRQAILFAAVIGSWQVAALDDTAAYYISAPSAIALQLAAWIREGEIWLHFAATASATATGFVVASTMALAFALLLASHKQLARILEPFLFAAFSTPKVVIAPLLILWIGVGHPPVVALAAVSCFFIVFYGAYGGLCDVPQIYLDTAAVLGAGRLRTAFQFRTPAAAPFVLASLQQGLIYAFHGAILGEMTASDTGLGYLVIYSATSQDAAAVLAALVIIGALSFVLVGLLGKVTQTFAAPLSKEALA
ncbi:MAG: putative transporter permease protein [Hyphomicrobiales bacterium]|nr:putative transporter permease protein [Hyphomicrobiales bacterium]